MGFPFAFPPPMFMSPPVTMGPVTPVPGSPCAPAMRQLFTPTVEQQEEYSLAFLNNQKQQIARMKEYFQECIKSLDESQEIIDKEITKIDAGRSHRKQAASETRSKR